jgi:outer membrane protein assembly factor BamE (lipoprotein component of BamABCDE complex)
MSKFILIFLSITLLANCSFKKVDKHHGVPFLEEKQKLLVVNKTNKNEIRKILGSPSTTSKFNNDVWIYIERKLTQSELKNLGRMKLIKNDVLVLEIDDRGILNNKSFYNKDDMENVKMVEATTEDGFIK